MAETSNDEVDEQKKIETSATDTCVQGQNIQGQSLA